MLEKKESKGERANLKLFFLDIFPSYEEIDENREGIIITFQNSDLIYNLEELIKNREEIFVPQQIPNQITRINLNKSNNLYASGPFTVKNGEQWVTFQYEHKKKQTSNFALSLIDCIKIKFLCKMDLVPAIITQVPSTEIQQKNDSILANIISKPSPKKLYSNYSTKKKNGHNNGNGLEHHDSLHTEENSKISKMLDNINPDTKSNMTNNLNNTTLSSTKNVNNHLLKSENLSEFNSLSASSGVIGKKENNNNSNNANNVNKNKIVKKAGNTVYNNNLNNINNSVNIESKKTSGEIGPINQKKKSKNYENNNLNKEREKKGNSSSMNNIANTIDSGNENKNSKQNLKRNKSKNVLDNKNKTSKKEKQTKNITSNNNNSNKENQTIKKIKKDLSTKNVSAFKKEEKENENIKEDIYDDNDDNENIMDDNNKIINVESNDMDITSKLVNDNYEHIEKNNEPLLDDYNEDIDNLGLDNFSKKLDDFQLLYNDDYIKGIKEEDYSLEIELYIEKLIELITEYHIQIEEKDLEYQLIKNMYKKNIFQYLEINKLNKKLELLKDDTILKKNNIKPINFEHDKNYINNLITNKDEINMFNFILYSEKEKEIKEKKEELKKILKIILNKPKYKNIINQNEKIVKWMQINMDKHNQIKEKVKKKNVGKQQKNQQDNNKEKGNRNDKKRKNEKNVSNSPSKSKNKLNKNAPEEKGKKK